LSYYLDSRVMGWLCIGPHILLDNRNIIMELVKHKIINYLQGVFL